MRRLLGGKEYDQVIDRLDVHRPAEWVAVDRMGARTLRALGQAYLGRGDLREARECLEQLRTPNASSRSCPGGFCCLFVGSV